MTQPIPWLSMVVATSLNNCIGKGNDLPWRIPEDLKSFKAITKGKTVVMGRKTWDSLPRKPLPERRNIVLTSHTGLSDCITANTMNELLVLLRDEDSKKGCCIIGGASLYSTMLPYATKLLLTRVHTTIEGDTYFPEVNWAEWSLQSVKKISRSPLESWLTEYKRNIKH